jgi:two-component system, OmpR family, phosphate regulon response regulator PhoB
VRALVVSADAEQLAALSRALEGAGIRAPLLSDLESAPDRLRDGRPDLIVLDGALPRLTLFRLYRELRQGPDTASTPILFAGFPDPPAERDGLDFYLPPAAEPEALTTVLRDLAGSGDRPEPLAAARDAAESPVVSTGVPAPVPAGPVASPAGRRPGFRSVARAVGLVVLVLAGGAMLLGPGLVPPTASPGTSITATQLPLRTAPPPPTPVAGSSPAPPVASAGIGSPAPTGGVRGRVLDARTGLGVPGATVRVTAAVDLVTTSGPDGGFEAFGVTPAGYNLRVVADGYRPAEGNVGVLEGSISEINLLVEPG